MRTPLREIHEDSSEEYIPELEQLRSENLRKDALINLLHERLLNTPKPLHAIPLRPSAAAERCLHMHLTQELERRKKVAERLEFLARGIENEIFRN